MKERPILFKAEMVRAILAGHKTQTRRLAEFVPYRPGLNLEATSLVPGHYCTGVPTSGWVLRSMQGSCWNDRTKPSHCRQGQPGDRLWVKECFWEAGDWRRSYPEDDEFRAWSGTDRIHFNADGNPPNEPNSDYPEGLRNGAFSASYPHPAKIWRKMSSLHMKRKYSRLLLEITAVRIERLNRISEQDAVAEGVEEMMVGSAAAHVWRDYKLSGNAHFACTSAKESYASLWEKINGAGSWTANPWVWVIEFRKVT